MIFVIFQCDPMHGGWYCKLLSSSHNDPREYLPEPVIVKNNEEWFLMDDLTMLKVEVN